MNQTNQRTKGNISTGYFLRFNSNEEEFENDLRDFLEANEYSIDSEGIKELLKDTIYFEEQDKKENIFVETLKNHPDEVAKGVETIGHFMGSMLNKKIFKK